MGISSNKDRLFLATTALEDFWDVSKPMLFLGDWCKAYDKKSIWENLDAQILSTELLSMEGYSGYIYSIEVYENLLPVIAQWLNQIHRVQYSLKYWRIVIGPFLLLYIQVLYNRFLYLKAAYALYSDLETIGLESSSYKTPINTHEFFLFAGGSDGWNLQLFTQLLRLGFKSPKSYRNYSWENEINQRVELYGKHLVYKPATKIKLKLIKLISKIPGSKIVGICFPYCFSQFSKRNLIKLMFLSRFRILPLTPIESGDKAAFRENMPNLTLRNEISRLSAPDDFSRMVLETLKFNMPLNFIEYYKEEERISEKCYPYRPDVIINPGIEVDLLKLWCAKHAEKGIKLFHSQHGGAYGELKYTTIELLERTNFDGFITSGWQENDETIAATSVFICEGLEQRKKPQNTKTNKIILWAVTDIGKYSSSYASDDAQCVRQLYFDWQYQFINSLSPNVASKLVMRTRPNSRYYNYIRDLFPTLNIYLPTDRSTFLEHLEQAAVLVVDNLNTTFKYGLSFNIPTILFWHAHSCEIREEAKSYYDAFQRVGIYHDSPQSAASMLNKIADDPYVWWNSKDVQLARQQYCDRYSRASPNWLKEWKDMLLGFADKK